jgi:hypothetical protein
MKIWFSLPARTRTAVISSSRNWTAVWDRDNGSGSTGRDLHGRYLGSDGQLRRGPFIILEDAGRQTSPAGGHPCHASRPLSAGNLRSSRRRPDLGFRNARGR